MSETEARLLARSERVGECLLWWGSLTPAGYGTFKVERRSVGVHRVAYQEWVGPIPEGLEIDHLCRVRNCIEPTHLEAVTHRVNVLRSTNVTAQQARRSACIRGHEFPPPDEDGKRRCRECLNRSVGCPDCGQVVRHKSLARHQRRCAARSAA